MTTDYRRILRRARTIAVVGRSTDPDKTAHAVPAFLQSAGFRVIPVHPSVGDILGETAYPTLAEVPEPVDIVDVFRPSAEAPAVAEQAVDAGAQVLWLQEGIRSEQAGQIATAGGLDYVENRCLGKLAAHYGIHPRWGKHERHQTGAADGGRRPGVSRAVARDLRRRYGDDYRVLRASSGDEALAALREVKLRSEPVAAMLADYRMPGMDGIEFLEQAMDLFPAARRALLTAYADTDAAIRAINVVDVDHYLMKPWDPPDEKLYPVVDALVERWRATDTTGAHEVTVVGHRFSAGSHRVRDFLARNLVPYRWVSVDDPEGRRVLTAANVGPDDIPLLVSLDGTALAQPDETQIAAAVGLSVEPAAEFYDLVVVGAGPAGLGAAVYGASEGLRTVLVERQATGGQAGQSSRIENYLGFPDGVSGAQLTERARRQAVKFGAEVLSARDVTGLEPRGGARVVRFGDDSSIAAHTVILATGVSYRALAAPGLGELTGRGVFYGAATTEASGCAGQDVYIVGGANSAGQAAVHLSGHARSVTMLVRGRSLEASMSRYLLEQIEALGNVSARVCTVVEQAHGTDQLTHLTLRDLDSGATETVQTGYLFVFIGAAPHTDWLDGVLNRDERGFVRTGPELMVDRQRPAGWTVPRDPYYLESSVPGVFVAGDVRADSVKRVASAVGEGAMTVTLVHRYLEAR